MENIIKSESANIMNEFKNNALKESTHRIFTRMVNVEDNKKAICTDLAEIYNNGTWKDDFGDFGDYTMTMFNITKSTASRMRRVSDKFITDINSPLNAEMFTFNQLATLVTLDNEVIENGNITPDMTIKQLREFVSNTKALEMKDTEEAEVEEKEEELGEIEEEVEEAVTAESCNVATNEEENPRDLAHFENLKELSMWVNKLMEKRENIENINMSFDITTKHTEY
jgi:hypothetical protein|nr:MAG TPA: Protein of unknown function (DUF3102) [Caudoviricetes sp.]